jgi:DNA replication protein DnaC
MARELLRAKGARVLFYEQRELQKELQSTYDAANARTESDVFRPIVNCDVLILDDLGAGRTTAWSRDVLQDVLVQRYNDRTSVLLTSNHSPEDEDPAERRDPAALSLRDRLGDSLMSRVYEMCRLVVVEGNDFRRGVLNATERSSAPDLGRS